MLDTRTAQRRRQAIQNKYCVQQSRSCRHQHVTNLHTRQFDNITMPVPYHTYDEHTIDDLKAFKCAFPKYSTCIRTAVVSLKLAKERTWQSKERNVRQQC